MKNLFSMCIIMDYKFIINPINGKKINIFSKRGKQILKNYLYQFGGSLTVKPQKIIHIWNKMFSDYQHHKDIKIPIDIFHRQILPILRSERYGNEIRQSLLKDPNFKAFMNINSKDNIIQRFQQALSQHLIIKVKISQEDIELAFLEKLKSLNHIFLVNYGVPDPENNYFGEMIDFWDNQQNQSFSDFESILPDFTSGISDVLKPLEQIDINKWNYIKKYLEEEIYIKFLLKLLDNEDKDNYIIISSDGMHIIEQEFISLGAHLHKIKKNINTKRELDSYLINNLDITIRMHVNNSIEKIYATTNYSYLEQQIKSQFSINLSRACRTNDLRIFLAVYINHFTTVDLQRIDVRELYKLINIIVVICLLGKMYNFDYDELRDDITLNIDSLNKNYDSLKPKDKSYFKDTIIKKKIQDKALYKYGNGNTKPYSYRLNVKNCILKNIGLINGVNNNDLNGICGGTHNNMAIEHIIPQSYTERTLHLPNVDSFEIPYWISNISCLLYPLCDFHNIISGSKASNKFRQFALRKAVFDNFNHSLSISDMLYHIFEKHVQNPLIVELQRIWITYPDQTQNRFKSEENLEKISERDWRTFPKKKQKAKFRKSQKKGRSVKYQDYMKNRTKQNQRSRISLKRRNNLRQKRNR